MHFISLIYYLERVIHYKCCINCYILHCLGNKQKTVQMPLLNMANASEMGQWVKAPTFDLNLIPRSNMREGED